MGEPGRARRSARDRDGDGGSAAKRLLPLAIAACRSRLLKLMSGQVRGSLA